MLKKKKKPREAKYSRKCLFTKKIKVAVKSQIILTQDVTGHFKIAVYLHIQKKSRTRL